MSFSALGLSDEIVRAVSEQGYTSPTPIQAQAVPAVLSGGDLMAGAQTGTGKTAGFTLPLLQRLASAPRNKVNGQIPIRALILAPTRELAAQVEESVRLYGKYLPLTSACIFGGVGINPQIALLKRGIDILVATPGRLLDHMQQGTVNLQHIQILVLDEADRMLDMGFIRDIRKVLAALPPKRQNLLFSATFADEIKKLADSLLTNPALIEVARRNSTVEVISQKIHPVDRDKKHPMLAHLIKAHQWKQVLVFTRTKHGANKLVEQLARDDISAMAIHGNKSQSARTKALAEFKDGKLTALIATDIAARGIDIDQLPHVVNYDLPNVPEDYVHRIGRTGRAGATGEAVSLVCIDERDLLHDIERFIKREIPVEVIPGFEPDPTAKPQPIQLRSGGGRHQNQGGGRGQRNAPPRKAGGNAPAGAKPAQGQGQGQRGNGNANQAAKPRNPANGAPNAGAGPRKPARPQGAHGGNAGNGGGHQGQPRSQGQRNAGGGKPSALTHGGTRGK
ncbi:MULTISPECIES: DEAD/DEAH box helicase [unclassified Herbaspirillum]|uniref:DEAD/DEAH box helicase n=1 Tax=unclassified Herbaspirillum TaxID=2624150 RepID=UPI001150A9EB|nr:MULTISPECIES: DEAD/DEAH box helicase [unclassified Herbaspirillum]MBB5392156.1 ATP-dependent RNA helicase RhlE [Herbaspirillum sp. SJZ102]TQK13613.1 ATP-dependent RNA helicase RhlE [Herbaspirillum sp. SJZ130]TQK15616.1 ATP-dependent RNA helicase RhlE [Herbaspirillum sp. SJZ106]TWC71515.1 ATP-dependent RNA helicase RhlE [Herbaspirillum sp. SJZ099]